MAGEPEYDVSVIRAIAEASFLISLVFVGIIAAGAFLTEAFRLPPLFPPPWNLLGFVLAAAGAVSLLLCGSFLSRHGRGTPYPRRPPRALVTTGPYARVRNPIVSSWGLLILGIAVGMNWTGLLLLQVPDALLVHAFIVYHEEPELRRRFGAPYVAYCRRVPRWIPRFRP